jgi:hypothetical protein
VEQRLDAEAVACEHEPARAGVPQRDREHAAQPHERPGALRLVEVPDHLGVAARAEAVPARLELAAQLGVVVDLAVLRHGDGALLRGDRLVAVLEVDDGQAARIEHDRPDRRAAVGVGAAMAERVAHRRHGARVGGPRHGDAADAAHV